MKNFRNRFILLLVSSVSIASCTVVDSEQTTTVIEDGDTTSTFISRSEALSIADKFWNSNATKSSDTLLIDSISQLSLPNNRVLYVANNADGNGYLIISASKEYFPIIAFSNSGTFCSSEDLIEFLNEEIDGCVRESIQNDTLQRTINYFWQAFNERSLQNTKSLPAFVSASMAEWTRDGYNYYSLADGYPDFLTQDEYAEFCRMAIDYNGDETLSSAFILCPAPDYDPTNLPYLIQTEWGASGYNPYSSVELSLGQIMKYFQYPSTFSWSSMTSSSINSHVVSLLNDINTRLDNYFSLAGVNHEYNNYTRTMDYYGYSYSTDTSGPSWPYPAFTSINQGKPVAVYGRTKSDPNPCFVRLIDGYQTIHANSIILKVLSPYSATPSFDTLYSTRAQTEYHHTFFHSNFHGQLIWHPISNSSIINWDTYYMITPNN